MTNVIDNTKVIIIGITAYPTPTCPSLVNTQNPAHMVIPQQTFSNPNKIIALITASLFCLSAYSAKISLCYHINNSCHYFIHFIFLPPQMPSILRNHIRYNIKCRSSTASVSGNCEKTNSFHLNT